jgi:hypothetical protein
VGNVVGAVSSATIFSGLVSVLVAPVNNGWASFPGRLTIGASVVPMVWTGIAEVGVGFNKLESAGGEAPSFAAVPIGVAGALVVVPCSMGGKDCCRNTASVSPEPDATAAGVVGVVTPP